MCTYRDRYNMYIYIYIHTSWPASHQRSSSRCSRNRPCYVRFGNKTLVITSIWIARRECIPLALITKNEW